MHTIIKSVPALLICLTVTCSVTPAAPGVTSVEKIRVIKTYGSPDEHTFNHPAQVALDTSSGRIYVLDSGIPGVIIMDTTGKFIQAFPEKNLPPDSLEEPMNIHFFKGFVWVLDNSASRMHQFTTDGKHVGAFDTGFMPFGLTGTGEFLICTHLLGDEIIPYNMYTGEIPRGYSKKPSKISIMLGVFKFFSKMSYLTSGPSGNIFMAYRHKNRIEKYNERMRRVERVDLTEHVNIRPAKKEKTDDGKWVIDGGTMFARDICYDNERVYVLWRVEEPYQNCHGQTKLSVFDTELQKQRTLVLEECFESIWIAGDMMVGTSYRSDSSVIFYKLIQN